MNNEDPENLAQKLRSALRQMEFSKAAFNRTTLFEVFETNPDLEQKKLLYQGYSKDLAETVLTQSFTKSEYKKDFMLYNHSSQDIIGLLWSENSKRLRGECSN